MTLFSVSYFSFVHPVCGKIVIMLVVPKSSVRNLTISSCVYFPEHREQDGGVGIENGGEGAGGPQIKSRY